MIDYKIFYGQKCPACNIYLYFRFNDCFCSSLNCNFRFYSDGVMQYSYNNFRIIIDSKNNKATILFIRSRLEKAKCIFEEENINLVSAEDVKNKLEECILYCKKYFENIEFI